MEPPCGRGGEGMNAYTAWAIKNIVALICWTALAIVFNKWWIALFVVFCLLDLKTKKNEEDTDG